MSVSTLLRAMVLSIPYLMWLHLPLHVLAQSTTVSRSAAVSASTTVYTGIPSLVFGSVPTMTACSTGLILWNVYNEDSSKINITLYAINEGIDQSIPSPSTTSAAAAAATVTSQSSRAASTAAISSQVALASSPRPTITSITLSSAAASVAPNKRSINERTILDLNISLVTQYANHGWGFNPVRLPEGRYYILGVVDDDRQTTNKSNVFSVVESDDTACLSAFKSLSASATGTATNNSGVPTQKVTSIPASTTNGNGTGAAPGSSEEGNSSSEKSSLGGGAVAGIVIGVLVGLVALVLLFMCYRRKKRSERDRNGNARGLHSEEGGFVKFGGHKNHHHKMPSDTTVPSSDLNHKNPIAMTPVHARADDSFRSDEKRGSLNSLEQDGVEDLPLPLPVFTPTTATSYNTTSSVDGGSGRRRSDPFTTPTLGEIPTMSPIYSNDEVRKLAYPTDSSGSGIAPPQPVILANVRRSSQEESPRPGVVGLGITGSGSGAGLKSANSFTSQSSLPYHQQPKTSPPVTATAGQSRSEPRKKRASLHGLGSPSASNTSPDPNAFDIPSSGSGNNTTPPSGGGLSRSTSSRRKPVPSLGPELRTELARQGSLKDLKNTKEKNINESGNGENGRRRSYKLMPDPPIIQE
ncbi:hypothetical protein I203_107186 [Kwoniella mangroviensis CBS 8507]|uniref:hypothetical protein n=1 Tax=Kwoniella mangroviensis CBS 8507 TaxID=1296122 RepID=UPI0030259319